MMGADGGLKRGLLKREKRLGFCLEMGKKVKLSDLLIEISYESWTVVESYNVVKIC